MYYLKGLMACIFRHVNMALLMFLVLGLPFGLMAQFAELPTIGLTGVQHSSVAWGDYDNDGDLDILLTGSYNDGVSHYISKIYRNNGNNTFTDINAGLTGVHSGAVAWGDYDNDGDLDILLSGYYYNGYGNHITIIYRNDSGIFTDIGADLVGVSSSSVAWGDFDNDGDLDILISGSSDGGSTGITKIYSNAGNSVFVDINANLIGLINGSLACGDYDNDGDLDILLTGYYNVGGASGTRYYASKVYRNNGNYTFSYDDLIGVANGSAAWGDYDNDGDLDILLTGAQNMNSGVAKVYRNDSGSFVDIAAGLPNMSGSSAEWGDYDNDGDLDILLVGFTGSEPISRVFSNSGNSTFTDISATLIDVSSGSVAWGDFDNDGDLDFIITGHTGTSGSSPNISNLYLNYVVTQNNVPNVPSNLRVNIEGDYLRFQWDASSDTQTPTSGLNYALRIGTTPGGNQICSPMASASGYRLIPVKGNANSSCSWKILSSALPESFYWSVQAIDTAFAGSAFATEQEFSSVPKITLITPQAIQYGDIPVNSVSGWSEVRTKNPASVPLTINNLHFYQASSQYNFSYPTLGNPIPAGEFASIMVRFAPTSVGAVTDTLYIESNAVNTPVLKIRLSGTGTMVPPKPPQNVQIVMNGADAILSWDAVTQTIFDTPIAPEYYLVFTCPAGPDGVFVYNGATTGLQYTHGMVGMFSPYTFYRVVAYKHYARGGVDITDLGLRQGMTEAEVMDRLSRQ